MMHRRMDRLSIIFMAAGGVILLFILAPLAGMFFHTPGSSLAEAIHDQEVTHSIALTLACAMGATL
ncbi:MAG: hypothetical protein PHQ69_11430, partial [Bacteroidales bacterium]|nr:hypothetical protein [Bacteroidales bacterium]